MVDSERVRYMYMYHIFYRLYLIADGGQWKSEFLIVVWHKVNNLSAIYHGENK
jgi:hypothetical protein